MHPPYTTERQLRFQVLTAASIKIAAFWDTAPWCGSTSMRRQGALTQKVPTFRYDSRLPKGLEPKANVEVNPLSLPIVTLSYNPAISWVFIFNLTVRLKLLCNTKIIGEWFSNCWYEPEDRVSWTPRQRIIKGSSQSWKLSACEIFHPYREIGTFKMTKLVFKHN
jgi:hypothetical protein